MREDVGRHNALDKLYGALLRNGEDPGTGAIVLSSRVSIDLVQKTARGGCPVLIAVSTPTVALARGGAFQVFTHPRRIA